MNALSLLCLLSLMLVVTSGNPGPIKPYYEDLGCWKDTDPKVVKTNGWLNKKGERNIDWYNYPNFANQVNKCGDFAKEKGCVLFAIQYWGECYCTSNAQAGFKKYKSSTNCLGGVGKSNANQVYRVKGCSEEGNFYEVGQKMPSSDVCNDCECTQSGHRRCVMPICKGDTNCPKLKKVKNECCPICACEDADKIRYQQGQAYTTRLHVGCADCVCQQGEKAECKPHPCPVLTCQEEILKPGSCCPECKPKAERITLPPTQPPEHTLPDFKFPSFPFPDKREEEAIVDDMAELVKEKLAASKED